MQAVGPCYADSRPFLAAYRCVKVQIETNIML